MYYPGEERSEGAALPHPIVIILEFREVKVFQMRFSFSPVGSTVPASHSGGNFTDFAFLGRFQVENK